MDTQQLKDLLVKAKEEGSKLLEQVRSWEDQRTQLFNAIQNAKEQHDVIRGRIGVLQEILGEATPDSEQQMIKTVIDRAPQN